MYPLTLKSTTGERLKLFIRRSLAAILFYSGINAVYRFFKLRHQVVVLMYHQVIDPSDSEPSYIQPGTYVTKQVFEMQMAYLARYYRILTLDSFLDALKSHRGFRRNTCLITFDDGWQDTYTQAFPVLRKYNVPAVVFLVSHYLGTTQRPWPASAYSLLTKYLELTPFTAAPPPQSAALEHIGFSCLASDRKLTPAQKIEEILERLKGLAEPVRDQALAELQALTRQHCNEEPSQPMMLSWNEVEEMSKFNISFGSHTKTHAILTELSAEKLFDEISESKRLIQKNLSTHCRSFCYPNGNHNPAIKKILKNYYECAFATEVGFVNPQHDLYTLNRIGMHNDVTFTKPLFACRLSGLLL